MQDQLRVVMSEHGADTERLDLLTRHLTNELQDLDDVTVDRVSVEAPPNTRAVDAVEIGSLLVTLLTSAALPQLVTTIRSWLGRGQAGAAGAAELRTVRLEMDGDEIELSGASPEEHERLIMLFVQRHQPAAEPT